MAEETADNPERGHGGPGDARPALPSGLVLEYRLEEPASLVDPPAFGHIERWTVSVLVERSNHHDDRRPIGYARVIVLNLEAGVSLADLADTATGDWTEASHPMAARTADPPGGPSDEDAQLAEASFLVLDRLWIEPDYRGHGLGPVTACSAILRLGRGCRLAACYPAPFEADQIAEDRGRSIEALGRIWAKVGFTPWNDGVWILDLHTTDMRDQLRALLPRTRHQA